MINLSDKTRRKIGYVVVAVTLGFVAADSVLAVSVGSPGKLVENLLLGASFGVVLILAIRAVPQNGAVWVMIWAAFFGILGSLGSSLGLAREGIATVQLENLEVALAPSQIDPLAALGLSLSLAFWVPAVFLLTTHLLILFPKRQGHK